MEYSRLLARDKLLHNNGLTYQTHPWLPRLPRTESTQQPLPPAESGRSSPEPRIGPIRADWALLAATRWRTLL